MVDYSYIHGVAGAQNREGNKTNISPVRGGRNGNDKWIIMGDFNGHIGFINGAAKCF